MQHNWKDLGQVLDRLLRFTRFPDDGSANLCTLVTFQRKTYFTFNRQPKRRCRTGPFRAKLTCKCPLIVCAMTYNYFLKSYFFIKQLCTRFAFFYFSKRFLLFSKKVYIIWSFVIIAVIEFYRLKNNLTRKHPDIFLYQLCCTSWRNWNFSNL